MTSSIWPPALRMMRPYGSGMSSLAGKQRKVRLLEKVPVDQATNRSRAEERRIAV